MHVLIKYTVLLSRLMSAMLTHAYCWHLMIVIQFLFRIASNPCGYARIGHHGNSPLHQFVFLGPRGLMNFVRKNSTFD